MRSRPRRLPNDSWYPTCLFTPEIIDFISSLPNVYNIKRFNEIDPIFKDKLIVMALSALDYDIEISLYSDILIAISKYLIINNKNNLLNLIKIIKNELYSCFDDDFNIVISEVKAELLTESAYHYDDDKYVY